MGVVPGIEEPLNLNYNIGEINLLQIFPRLNHHV